MKITIESTTKLVTLATDDGGDMPARVWEGFTESGIPVHCFVTRIAVPNNADHAQFERELKDCRAPTLDLLGRLIL